MTDPTPAEIFDESMGIVNMPDPNDMQAQQARADAILADFAAGVNDSATLPDDVRAALYKHPDTQLTPEILESLDIHGPPAIAALIESAEVLKRAIGEAEQALEAELAPMRAKLKEAEDALRSKALEQGETIKGAHIQVQIVAPSVSVKWDDKGLSGAVAMLPAEWRQAILAHRKTDEKPASTRIVYK